MYLSLSFSKFCACVYAKFSPLSYYVSFTLQLVGAVFVSHYFLKTIPIHPGWRKTLFFLFE
jgi:hypothetical protein